MSGPAPVDVLQALERAVVGQRQVVEALLVALIAGGHILLEGFTGLAKTHACRTLADALGGNFKRIQFTPDLLPSDIVGVRTYDQRTCDFTTILGPLFSHVVLADEINRAPARVQSALLEAMQEAQATIGPATYTLPEPFFVMATMNPGESDGTYPLAAAQLDRFALAARAVFPSLQEELLILERRSQAAPRGAEQTATLADVLRWRRDARGVFIAPEVKRYAVELVLATRNPGRYGADFAAYLERPASPRATLALAACSRASALLAGRTFVLPDDVRDLAAPVLRHRVAFHARALLENVDGEAVLRELIAAVPVP